MLMYPKKKAEDDDASLRREAELGFSGRTRNRLNLLYFITGTSVAGLCLNLKAARLYERKKKLIILIVGSE